MRTKEIVCSLFLLMGLTCIQHTAQEVFAADVEYQTFQNEKNSFSEECEVYCHIPYSYVETISKEPESAASNSIVQTGDDSNIWGYSAMSVLSGFSLYRIKRKERNKQ